MLTEVFYLHEKGSLADARLCTYILDDSDSIAIEKRPMMLICPGGGYEHTSDREAEPLAMHFLSIGYHVAVLRYSVAPAVYPLLLLSVRMEYRHSKETELPAAGAAKEKGGPRAPGQKVRVSSEKSAQ